MRRFLLALAAAVALLPGVGPCGPVPGGRLDGPVVESPVADWSFAEPFVGCQLELRPEDPHSINASCFVVEGALYVGSWLPSRKRWVGLLADHPEARVRVAGRVYPVVPVRVEDAERRLALLRARDGADAELPAREYAIWELLSAP